MVQNWAFRTNFKESIIYINSRFIKLNKIFIKYIFYILDKGFLFFSNKLIKSNTIINKNLKAV